MRRRVATAPARGSVAAGVSPPGNGSEYGRTVSTHNEIASLLDGVGFDPYLGFYHQPEYGRPSLAADLVEEFRAPVVDRLTLRLAHLRLLSPHDFELHAASGGLHLTHDGLKRYLAAYDALVGGIESEVIEASEAAERPATGSDDEPEAIPPRASAGDRPRTAPGSELAATPVPRADPRARACASRRSAL